jgi:hypothetical protein
MATAIVDLTDKTRKILGANSSLLFLYSFAYRYEITLAHGATNQIIFDSKKYSINDRFCYELVFPKDRYQDRQALELMQRELDRALGLSSQLARKQSEVYVIEIIDSSRAISRGEKETIDHVEYTEYRNVDFGSLSRLLSDDVPINLPVVCEGRSKMKIDVTLQKRYKDLASMQASLRRHGLNVFMAIREVDFLIIKDAEKK